MLTVDYAKKTPQPPTKRRRLWIIALIILVLVLSIPVLFYMHYLHMPHFHIKNTKSQPLIKHKKSHHTHQQKPHKQFDFYAMLPKMNVNVKNASPTTSQIPLHKPYYLLQIATSSDKQATEHLVTELGVMGLNASAKTTYINGKIQYQIVVGPYLKNKNALTDQAYLKTNHINSIKLRIRNYPKR